MSKKPRIPKLPAWFVPVSVGGVLIAGLLARGGGTQNAEDIPVTTGSIDRTQPTDPSVQDRNPDHLHPLFRPGIEHWLKDARAWLAKTGRKLMITETFRTAARQEYLYAQGRTRPGNIITYTLDSAHEYGLAVDTLILNANGTADWNTASYDALFRAVPPGSYGLETLSFERVHIQLRGVNGPNQNVSVSVWAKPKGIVANALVGSRYA